MLKFNEMGAVVSGNDSSVMSLLVQNQRLLANGRVRTGHPL